jgi:sialidase-1
VKKRNDISRRGFIGALSATSAGFAVAGWTACGRTACDRTATAGKEQSVYYDVEIHMLCEATEHNPRNSEASIIELKDGSLLMAWQRIEKSELGHLDEAPGGIAMMNSSDGGRSWGNFRMTVERGEGFRNCYSPNFLRSQNGDILLVYLKFHESHSESLSSAFVIRSRDEGQTFGAPETVIWEKAPRSFPNSNIRRLASSGRVILPFEIQDGRGQIHISTVYSDDDCRTWIFSQAKIMLPMRGAMEPFIEELSDGRLIMVMRNQLGSLFKSYSPDSGVTWSKPQTTGLAIPESCPYISTVPGSDRLLVIWNNSEYDMHFRGGDHYGRRSPLTAAISADGGVTFTDFWNIETDEGKLFSNPGITWTSDGVCLLTYWTCDYLDNGEWGDISLKLARFRVGS